MATIAEIKKAHRKSVRNTEKSPTFEFTNEIGDGGEVKSVLYVEEYLVSGTTCTQKYRKCGHGDWRHVGTLA